MNESLALDNNVKGLSSFGNTVSIIRVLLAVVLCVFSLYTAFFGVFPDVLQQGVHISIVLALVYTLPIVSSKSASLFGNSINLIFAIIAFSLFFYHVVFYEAVAGRWGALTGPEFWMGIFAVIALLEATRRAIGLPMVILVSAFILYAFIGPWLPDLLSHRGYSAERVIGQLYLGGGGIFGTPLMVSSTFVILIVIFGAVLEKSGASGALMDIATGATGRTRGGPAKASVVGSSLMGTISGTAVANVLTTGTISIPLMIRNGYRPHIAGAVEAVASTGGQLMPPVMGAAAFIMSEITAIPYLDIALSALIPSLIYYVVLFSVVHLEAVKKGIQPLAEDEVPSVSKTFLRSGHLLLGIPALVIMLFQGYSIMYASFWAIVVALITSFLRRDTRVGPSRLVKVCVAAGEAIIPVAVACASAGIVIGIITLTGVGLKFSSLIITLSGGNLFFALLLTMLASLVLGMGLPTAAAYILVATLVAPALVDMGVTLLAAHMFVFYSAMLSAITPPVALAAYAAASIAKANPLRIAVTASFFGIAAFVVPYAIVVRPALLGEGSFMVVATAVVSAITAGVALAAMVQGYLLGTLAWYQRIILGAASLLMLLGNIYWFALGLGLAALVIFIQIVSNRNKLDTNTLISKD